MIVQIYEIQRMYEARMLKQFGVDHVGTVVEDVDDFMNAEVQGTVEFVNSRGMVSSLIPLFSNEEKVMQTVQYYRPQIVHFCESLQVDGKISDETERFLSLQQKVKQTFPYIKTMRSIPVGVRKVSGKIPTFDLMKMFAAGSDYFLIDTVLDAKRPKTGSIGITGKTCDWDVAAEVVKRSPIPVILAGGLDGDNVAEAIAKVRPYGVDSCTRTNALDEEGKIIRYRKDMEKVKAFIDNAR